MDYKKVMLTKEKFATELETIKRNAIVLLCTEKGINLAREFARENLAKGRPITRALICFSSTYISYLMFMDYYQKNYDIVFPFDHSSILDECVCICQKCSPKDGTGVGIGAGAIGGFLLGGPWVALAGAVLGGIGGNKLTEEAQGEKYYTILRESISTLFFNISIEINCLIEDWAMNYETSK
jgi:hypothetical protein